MDIERFKKLQRFEWDKWNIDKIYFKHRVEPFECEEVFFDENKVMLTDVLHSVKEEKHILLGKTKENKLLFIVFTTRGNKIRIISARDINKKERHLYEKSI